MLGMELGSGRFLFFCFLVFIGGVRPEKITKEKKMGKLPMRRNLPEMALPCRCLFAYRFFFAPSFRCVRLKKGWCGGFCLVLIYFPLYRAHIPFYSHLEILKCLAFRPIRMQKRKCQKICQMTLEKMLPRSYTYPTYPVVLRFIFFSVLKSLCIFRV